MVDGETIETKISDKKDEFEEKTDEKKDDMKDKYEETKEKGKTIADNVISDLSRSIDEFKENLKNMQKAADKKYADYKKTTVQSLDVDLVETEDVYYVKASVPGIDKEDILIEAGDNDISIEATFVPYIEEFEEDEAELIVVYQLAKNGGDYILLDDSNKFLKWCNDYAELNEADRYFSKDERDVSVRDIYYCISKNDSHIKNIKENLEDNSCEEAEELLKQLDEFIGIGGCAND